MGIRNTWGTRGVRVIILASFLGLGGNAVAWSQSQDSIGHVAEVQGQATVRHAGSTQTAPLQVQHPVFREDTIETFEGAKIKLLLKDSTELSLAERGSMTLSKFVFAPQKKTQQGVVSIAQGFFRAVTHKAVPQTNFEVRTSTAVAAVRGTQWLGDVSPEATAIVVLQGEVAVRHADPTIKGAVRLTHGLGTDVVGKTPPTAPKQWAERRVSTLLRATAFP